MDDEVEAYAESMKRFLEDDGVGTALAEAVLQLDDGAAPEVGLFRAAWKRLGGKALPAEFRWETAVSTYGKLLQKEKFRVPALREIATAEMHAAIRDELRAIRRQGGVHLETDAWRYAERMKTKYRALDLASISPPTGDEGGGLMFVRDAFIPQDVRENPPAVELPRDLLRKLEARKDASEEGAELDGSGERQDRQLREQMERMRASYAERPREPVLAVLGRPDTRRVVLLGHPGSGKSTLARYLLLMILERPADEPPAWLSPFADHLPILIELREYVARRAEGVCESFLEFLNHLGKSQGYFLDQDGLDRRLANRSSLVIFDGLDEVFAPAERERVMQEIAGFADAYPKARIVVTSRPAGYKDAILKAADFRHYALEDLSDSQIETFVTGWFALAFPDHPAEAQARRERVARAIKARSVRILAGNPMLLTLMALLARHQELPRERAEFYRHAAEALCHHWDVNRHLEEVGLAAQYMGLDDKKELLRRIAFRMQNAPEGLAGNFILGADLELEIEGYFRERYPEVASRAKRIAEELIRHLHERNHVLCLYGPGLYGFVHRTFLEYFCATEFARRLKEDPEYSIDRLIAEAYAPHWEDDAWQEVLRLICGMVGEVYGGKVIEFLSGPAFPDWRAMVEKRPPRNLLLGIQCLSEVRNRNAIEPACTALLRAIAEVLEIDATPMWTLWDLEALVRNGFLEAAREVAPLWPGRKWLRARFDSHFSQLSNGLPSEYALLVQLLFPADSSLYQEFLALAQSRVPKIGAAAATALARGWPQEPAVRQLLENRAAQHESSYARMTAIEELARGWKQDLAVRQLLENRTSRDEDSHVRSTALAELARGWEHDSDVRQVLENRAARDESYYVRRTALEELARGWQQDSAIQQLLGDRAVQDQDGPVRSAALAELLTGWPQDPAVRQLLENRAADDADVAVRGTALAELAQTHGLGHRARTVLSRHLDADSPFLDPHKALPNRHLKRAAEKLGCTLAELEAEIADWSKALGWDLMVGLRTLPQPADSERPPSPP
ncbi:MAG TPA: HEAT repeat domain-containing protein [Thermoanaerobaculia bacterium]